MTKTITMEKDGNFLKVGNKWYAFQVNEDGDFMTGQFTMREVDRDKFIRKVDRLTKRLFSFVDPKLVIHDALKDMSEEDIDKLDKYLEKHKGKIKPKTEKHCVRMNIGGVAIPIR